jgi:hypothetical protein|tara:strand:+ start:653 stop:1252 length:600 start_codon:yes stop_codon:yes gene_type:complete
MNIFVLDEDPIKAAKMYCDRHIPKMCVELLQQIGSAAIKHGAQPEQLPLAKATQKPIRGGYHNHPCTIWVSMSRDNYLWAAHHGAALCEEYTKRFGKEHYCANGIEILYGLSYLIPEGDLTPFALAMPDDYRPHLNEHIGAPFDIVPNDDFTFISHASGDDAVQAYRRYYHAKAFAKWEKGRPMPDWFDVVKQAVLADA